ncbi:Mitochondrial folate transporter/carrier, partial [Trichinella spiralis]
LILMLDYIHLIAGLAGGFVSTLVVHPLDLLKIRHAVNEKYSGLRPALNNYLHSACSIFRERSFIGFYQGITPNLIGSTLAWGLYFAQYNWFKDFLRQWFQLENLSAWHALIAGIYAGNVTLLLTNPVWVAKTRLCLQYENQPKQYRGMIDVLVKLYRMDGIRGLYKGYLPGIVGTSHGAIQFMAYDELKKHFGSHEPKASEHLTFAVLSKSFAVLSTYPYQVIRARLQDQHLKYNGIMDAVSRTWRREWLYGFYKGLLPSLLRVTPATCITIKIVSLKVSKQVDSSVAMFMLSVVLFGTLVNYGMASNVGRGNWIPVYPLIPIGEKEPEFTQRPRPAAASTAPPARTEAVVSDVKIADVGREYRRHTSQDPFYADIPDQEIDYIPTSGAESSCKRHEHCYEKREPSEWCILQAGIKYTLIATAVRTNVAVSEQLTSFIFALRLSFYSVNSYCEKGRVLNFTMKLVTAAKTDQICMAGIYFGNLLASEMNKSMINDRIEGSLQSS